MRLLDNSTNYKSVFFQYFNILEELGLEDTPDNRIISTAYYYNKNVEPIIFVTNDMACKLIARNIANLEVESIKNEEISYYGYKSVILNDTSMASFYENLKLNTYECLVNEYLIIRDEDGNCTDIRRWDGEMYSPTFNKTISSRLLGKLKARDEYQLAAIDSIHNNEITVLYGKAGSGKTTLPLNYIMQEIEKGHFKKCYFVYSFEPLKGAKTLGFEKGDHITKLLYSSSIGNILASKFGGIHQVESLMNQGILDIIPTANIRGVEFADACVFVTEAQNLDVYTLKTIIQRCKTGCKQIYEGDIIEQKDTNIQMTGISRMIDVFKGNDNFGVVKLKNNYRSKLSELADLM